MKKLMFVFATFTSIGAMDSTETEFKAAESFYNNLPEDKKESVISSLDRILNDPRCEDDFCFRRKMQRRCPSFSNRTWDDEYECPAVCNFGKTLGNKIGILGSIKWLASRDFLDWLGFDIKPLNSRFFKRSPNHKRLQDFVNCEKKKAEERRKKLFTERLERHLYAKNPFANIRRNWAIAINWLSNAFEHKITKKDPRKLIG